MLARPTWTPAGAEQHGLHLDGQRNPERYDVPSATITRLPVSFAKSTSTRTNRPCQSPVTSPPTPIRAGATSRARPRTSRRRPCRWTSTAANARRPSLLSRRRRPVTAALRRVDASAVICAWTAVRGPEQQTSSEQGKPRCKSPRRMRMRAHLQSPSRRAPRAAARGRNRTRHPFRPSRDRARCRRCQLDRLGTGHSLAHQQRRRRRHVGASPSMCRDTPPRVAIKTGNGRAHRIGVTRNQGDLPNEPAILAATVSVIATGRSHLRVRSGAGVVGPASSISQSAATDMTPSMPGRIGRRVVDGVAGLEAVPHRNRDKRAFAHRITERIADGR